MINEWAETSPGTYVCPDGPQQMLQGVFLYPPSSPLHQPVNTWDRVSLARSPALLRGLPAGKARYIRLGGLLIITASPQVGEYGLTMAVRRAGSTYESPYTLQALAVNQTYNVASGDGARSPGSVGVHLDPNAAFEFKYTFQAPGGQWPSGLGLNFLVEEWCGVPGLFPPLF